jgi:hypothetical protein
VGGLRREVVKDPAAMEGLAGEWRGLVDAAGGRPFSLPDWLLPWRATYAAGEEAILIVWQRAGRLVGLAPLHYRRLRRRGWALTEVGFWGATGTPLSGWVDLVALPEETEAVGADFRRWLDHEGPPWSAFSYLRLPADSPTPRFLAGVGRWHGSLAGIVRSEEAIRSLPSASAPDGGVLGAKARHELRRELRRYHEDHDGRVEVLSDPADPAISSGAVVEALADLLRRRWGAGERYLQVEPRFGVFLRAVVDRSLASGRGYLVTARDAGGWRGILFCLAGARETAALLVAVDPAPGFRRYSVGKALFARAMEVAVERGCETFNFLPPNGYKVAFWHARSRPLASGIVTRGWRGALLAAYVVVRRVLPARLRRRRPPPTVPGG